MCKYIFWGDPVNHIQNMIMLRGEISGDWSLKKNCLAVLFSHCYRLQLILQESQGKISTN